MPILKFTGKNGAQLASELTVLANRKVTKGHTTQIVVNENHTGKSLSLSQVFDDGQVVPDRYRVPVGMSLNTETGEVLNDEGVAQDYEDLIKEN